MTTQESLVGFAFPVVKVRFAGPTNYKGSRYIATLRGVRHTEHYDHALSGSQNAYNAAEAVYAKYRQTHAEAFEHDTQERILIPGDLDDSSYAFTIVPVSFVALPEVLA